MAIESRVDEAQASFEAALHSDPDNIAALSGLATCEYLNGSPEKMLVFLAQEQALDPEIAHRKPFELRAGLAALFAGNYEQSIEYLLQYEAQDLAPPKDTDQDTPSESARLYLVAAYELKGDHATAVKRLRAFSAVWRHRSVWRELSYLPAWGKPPPGLEKIREALIKAGMIQFSDEHQDDGAKPSPRPLNGSDFTPTPLTIPGGQVIDTVQLRNMLARSTPPIIVQVGSLQEVLPGALTLTDAEAAYGREQMLQAPFGRKLAAGPSRGVVVMGTGPAGVQGYNAALHFISLKFGPIYWYRGGEEAWAALPLTAHP